MCDHLLRGSIAETGVVGFDFADVVEVMSCPPVVTTTVFTEVNKGRYRLADKILIPTNLAVVIWAVYRQMSGWSAAAAYMTME